MDAFLKYFEMIEKKGWRLQELPWERADWERLATGISLVLRNA